jgi:hypothetical protein
MRKSVGMSVLFLFAAVGAAHADTWTAGQEVTYTGPDWNGGSEGTTASTLLNADFNMVYSATVGVLTVGSTFTLEFDSAAAVEAYVPSVGPAAALDASLSDPTTSASGVFGGDVVTLALNIDFNNAGLLGSTSSVPFGDLILANLTDVTYPYLSEGPFDLAGLDGLTVSQFLAIANTCLGGGSCGGYSLDDVDALTEDLNDAFVDGTPDAFANDSLALPTSPTTTPEPSSLLLLTPGLAALAFLRRRFLRAHERSHT